MLIDEKRLMRNYTLKPAYPANIGDLNAQEVYKEWFTYAMIGVNRYVELLHKQLIRKKRSQTQSVEHPLFKNPYIVKKHNIKSGSKAPYHRENYSDLGLNQFFVGQDPYEPYQGDPGSENGIYHDICELRVNYHLGKTLIYEGFPGDLALLFEKKQAYKYHGKGFYYIDEAIDFKAILEESLKNVSYEMLVNEVDVVIFTRTFFKNDAWVYPSLNDLKIPSIKVQSMELKRPSGKPYKKICVDVEAFYEDLKRFNADIFRVEKLKITYPSYEKVKKTRESDSDSGFYTLTHKEIPFLEVFKRLKKSYRCKYVTPLCFYQSFNVVCYEEPYIALAPPHNLNAFRKDTSVKPSIYPLYRKSSNLPYGRRDRWFALWDSFYYLYVYEKSSKGILKFLAPVVTIVLAVATWWAGGQGVWLGALLGISEAAAAAISLGISVGLAVGSLSGNKFFTILNAAWNLANFVGAWGNNGWNLAADFTKTTAQAAQELTALEATLNVMGNVLNGASSVFNVMQSITADTPDFLGEGESENDEDGGNGKEAEELAKEMINPTLWYDFETADILNEKVEKRQNPLFIF